MGELVDLLKVRVNRDLERNPIKGQVTLSRRTGQAYIKILTYLSNYFRENDYRFGITSMQNNVVISYQLKGVIIKNA